MLRRTARRLTIINVLVFILILTLCSATDYILFVHDKNRDNEEDLRNLMAVVVSSIEAPEKDDDDDDDDDIPDVVQPDERALTEYPLPKETIQWFSPQGKLLAERGLLKIRLPLNTGADFQEQQNEHALILTNLVQHENRTLGYLRVSMPLSESDRSKRNLLVNLILGTLFAVAISGVAILWLVRQSLKPVAMSMQLLADFSADASHELQGPVMAIKTNCAVALKYSEGMRESDKEKIETIINAADQMSTTIDGLLRLAELEQPLSIQEFKQIKAKALMEHLCNELNSAISSKSIRVNLMIADPELSFRAIENDAKTALLNVFRNAIMYSHEGSPVLITARKTGRFVEFKIEDFGIGISSRDIPKIFNRFWRSDKARTYGSEGKGLGLAITKNIIERYKGSIFVESKPGVGSCFTLRFPQNPG